MVHFATKIKLTARQHNFTVRLFVNCRKATRVQIEIAQQGKFTIAIEMVFP